jgi:hypothetical protein
VAAIDEKTGAKVWRKVTAIFSKQSASKVDLELQDADGKRTKIKTTLEHPFHVEHWDGKVETMVAALNGQASVDPSRLFPSDDKTQFGDWVKAGALKAGDQVSTADSIENFGPRLANDNAPLTVTDIIRDSRAARVYNFEVESQNGEVTHNYFVGDDAAWVHNGRGAAWKAIFNNPKTSSRIRGWIQQELNAGRTFSNLRSPPGCDLGHHPSNRGPHGPSSRPENPASNRARPGLTDNNPLWR